jgi:hypothetical protein
MSDRDKEEFENISYWTEFLLNNVKKKKIAPILNSISTKKITADLADNKEAMI